MKKTITSSLVAAMLIAGVVATAKADDHTTPGIPGTPNCRGQTTAFLAQAAKNGIIDDAFHGIGGVGRFADLSVKDVHAVINAFCNASPT